MEKSDVIMGKPFKGRPIFSHWKVQGSSDGAKTCSCILLELMHIYFTALRIVALTKDR